MHKPTIGAMRAAKRLNRFMPTVKDDNDIEQVARIIDDEATRELVELLQELESHATRFKAVPLSADLLWNRVRAAIAKAAKGDQS